MIKLDIDKLASFLISIGLRWKALIAFQVFLIFFILTLFCFIFSESWQHLIYGTLVISPLIILTIANFILIFNNNLNLKNKMIKHEHNPSYTSEVSSYKSRVLQNIHVAIACLATYIAFTLIITLILLFLGLLKDVFDIFAIFNGTIGILVIFIIFWPIYSKYMK